MEEQKTLCIIPARGGSKRIPRKNVRNFLGKPIIAYSIEVALASGLFDEVMVSTDDEEVANISKVWGAEIPFLRSNKNADDFATIIDVISEVVEEYKKKSKEFKYICCIFPTAPLLRSELLLRGFEKLKKENFDSVVSVQRANFPIQRALKIENDKVRMFWPGYINSRSQDLEPAFHDAGQFNWCRPSLLEKGTLWTSNTGFIEVEEIRSQDIDNETDWKLAEMKYQLLND